MSRNAYLQLYLYFVPVKRTILDNSGIFFITFICHQWLSLIDTINGYDIIYNWFDHLKSKGHFINGYVIMPNHVHALISFINTTQSINTIICNGKRFMAYEIINRLEKNNETTLLEQLSGDVEATRKVNKKLHEDWELSFVPITIGRKYCRSNEFVWQNLDYMYNNPQVNGSLQLM